MNTSTSAHRWQFWIDRGGSFTDIVAQHPDGHLLTHNLLSDNPEHYQDVTAVQGIRELLGLVPSAPIPSAPNCRRENGHHRRNQCPT